VAFGNNATGGGAGSFWFGGESSSTSSKEPFLGRLDEVRVAPVVRSAEWMATEYRSMTDALIDYGPEEQF
jgi:hypothetical protein